MTRLAHLAQRLFNVPLMIHPRKAEVVVAALAERIGVGSMLRLEADQVIVSPMAFDDDDEFAAHEDRPGRRQSRSSPVTRHPQIEINYVQQI